MNLSRDIERALSRQSRQGSAVAGLKQVDVTRARILDVLGLQPPLVEWLTDPYLMVDGVRTNLPACYVEPSKPTRTRTTFDVWSPWLAIAVDYVPRSVAEVEAKIQYCATHSLRYCHVGDAKLNDVCDALASVVAERRALRGLEKVEKPVGLRREIVLGSRRRTDPDYPNG